MKYTKVEAGNYKAENGMTIRKKVSKNIWTGRAMSSREDTWHVYDASGKNVKVTITLREAKNFVETGSIFG